MSEFDFAFTPGDQDKPVILGLHGTGGDEHAFTEILKDIAPNYPIFGVRGQVSEHGANRYFRRFAEGKLDYEDLALRTEELTTWLKSRPEFQDKMIIALGYSNGANMAANLLLTNQGLLNGAILLRPMFLPTQAPNLNLNGVKVQLHVGVDDQICPAEQGQHMARVFSESGADVSLKMIESGHNLTQADIQGIAEFTNNSNY